MPDYVPVPIPTLVTPRRKRNMRRGVAIPVYHPGTIHQPRGWVRHRTPVKLVPSRDETHPPMQLRKVAP